MNTKGMWQETAKATWTCGRKQEDYCLNSSHYVVASRSYTGNQLQRRTSCQNSESVHMTDAKFEVLQIILFDLIS